jgi:hypothetical protein
MIILSLRNREFPSAIQNILTNLSGIITGASSNFSNWSRGLFDDEKILF